MQKLYKNLRLAVVILNMRDLLTTVPTKNSCQNMEVIDLTDKNLFEAIQVIISTSGDNVCKKSSQIIKYRSNIPNIENVVKDIPILTAIEFI